MSHYLDTFINGYTGYARYLWHEITHPSSHNYFYLLIGVSLLVMLLELVAPWRKKQAFIRRDFFLDAFYMFFNFFLFSLVAYNAVSEVVVQVFNDTLALVGIQNLVAINVQSWPVWAQLGLMFLVTDFVHWNVHRLLHRVPWLWQFHKVHHSVKEMGFAAHLRFHWMESVVYKSLQYIPLAMLGFGITDFFIVHAIGLLVGHINHANIPVSYGPLKYVLNNPKMHIWHHVKALPGDRYGVNFGLTLSVWDYLFGTAYIPHDGRDIELGFEHDEQFPQDFLGQVSYPWSAKSKP